tara:strand:- start:795 stop:1121 length:327 start_codon:yes stop_codon:yes gene_type:complete
MSNETFKELEKTTLEFAQAESEKVYLMEYRKSLKAILMAKAEANNPSLAIAKQEREAYADPEYIEFLKGLKVAVEKSLSLRFKVKVIEMKFESWRSKQATSRAEMTLR